MSYGRASKKHTRQPSRKDRAEERRARLPACDFCSSGDIPVHGWHIIEDPDNYEGTTRIPCARR